MDDKNSNDGVAAIQIIKNELSAADWPKEGSVVEVELVKKSARRAYFDMGRFGVEFVASPRHADGVVISGTTTQAMAHALEATYEAVPHPKLVILFGACAISGGIFQGSDRLARETIEKYKIDLYIPGCPPHPLTFLHGLLGYLGKIGPEAAKTAK